MENRPVKITILVTPIVLKSDMLAELRVYLESRGGEIEIGAYNARDGYRSHFNKSTNLITWGVKWKSAHYKRKGRNVLFLENGLLCQRKGIYCDHRGYFVDSSIVADRESTEPVTPAERERVVDHLRRCWKWEWGETRCDPAGPILVAMQMNGDAPLRHHFPLAKGHGNRKEIFLQALVDRLPADREVILRPHPREKTVPPVKLPANWRVDSGGTVYEALRRCSGLVTVNSTVATEALGLQMPVATFGYGSFHRSGVTLDCAEDADRVSGLLDFRPDPDKIMGYFAAVLRHQLPYRHGDFTALFEKSMSVQSFVDNLKTSDPAPIEAEKPETRQARVRGGPLKTCVFCGKDTVNMKCKRCRCTHCKKRNP